jgi:hypothetical protein
MLPSLPRVPLADRASLSVPETLATTGWSRTAFYSLVKSGELTTFTVGRRRFVSGESLRAFIDARAQSGAIPAEVSIRKAAAGQRGRALQLAQKAKP